MSFEMRMSAPKKPYDFETAMLLPFQTGSRRGAYVLKSALFYMIGYGLLVLVFNDMLIKAGMSYHEQLSRSPELFLFALLTFGLKILPYMLGMWALWVMVETSFFRRVMFGGEDSWFPWRFGQDEMRVMFCQFVVAVILMVAALMASLIFGAIVMSIGYVLGDTAENLFSFISWIGIVLVVSAVAIRFAPAAAQSVAEKRIALGAV